MRKMVYLYKRRAGLDIEHFHRELAERAHGDPILSSLPGYVLSTTLVQGYRRGELLFDAVEEFNLGEKPGAPIASGETGLPFDLPRGDLIDGTNSMSMCVDIHVIKNGPIPHGGVKNIEFVNRRPDMKLDPFRQYWREVHGPLAAAIPSIARYEQAYLAREIYETNPQPRYDGLAVTWFPSTSAMREGARTLQYETTRADEENFLLGHLPTIIVRELLRT